MRCSPYISLGVGILLLISGCSVPRQLSEITISLEANERINDGVLLPLDIIAVDTAVSVAVLSVSPDEWFGNDLRGQLTGEEITKLAIGGGGTRQVKIRVPDKASKVVVYADFENAGDRPGQQLVIVPEKLNFAAKYTIKIHENRMELVQ